MSPAYIDGRTRLSEEYRSLGGTVVDPTPADIIKRMILIKKIKQAGGEMCTACLDGKHQCTTKNCTCVCNEEDFPNA